MIQCIEALNVRSAEAAIRSVLGLSVLSVTKVTDVSVRQLSKAKRPSCAPGASTLVVSALLREQHSAKTLRLNGYSPGLRPP